jgi:DNA ligase (NAD+)
VVVEQLLERQLIRDASDLYRLKQDDLLQLPLFGPKKANNLLKAIEASRQRGLERLVYALGLRHVGEKVAAVLARHFGSMQALARASIEELQSVDDIGMVIAGSLVAAFKRESVRSLIKRLEAAGVSMRATQQPVSNALAGKTFVFTGTLPTLSREEASRLVMRLGGRVAASVSKQTDYVVAGDEAGSKLSKAQALGVKVLDERAFTAMVDRFKKE